MKLKKDLKLIIFLLLILVFENRLRLLAKVKILYLDYTYIIYKLLFITVENVYFDQ